LFTDQLWITTSSAIKPFSWIWVHLLILSPFAEPGALSTVLYPTYSSYPSPAYNCIVLRSLENGSDPEIPRCHHSRCFSSVGCSATTVRSDHIGHDEEIVLTERSSSPIDTLAGVARAVSSTLVYVTLSHSEAFIMHSFNTTHTLNARWMLKRHYPMARTLRNSTRASSISTRTLRARPVNKLA
jgi:hypothetical protein